ncbi:uncharacterized protein isoform X1 [Choristoneura fumiferana]|uniref:uncharacterized protein isoform X1 n=1 Tax=Choristoneura fumiferana TaxID=7141 RepID=UPI003D1585C8
MDDTKGECSKAGSQARPTRNRDRSSSSSSSRSSSSSASSCKPGPRRRRHRKSKKRGGTKKELLKLTKLVNSLQAQLARSNECVRPYDNISDISDCSRNLYVENEPDQAPPVPLESEPFAFGLGTKLKEPAMPSTSEGELKLLCDVQRLNHNEWFNLRYAEIQKVYNHTPGYTDLETNDEVKEYDQNPHLVQADRAFGALTYCMIKQQEALHAAVQDVLAWAQGSTEIVHESLREKLNSVFLSGDYYKVSEDFLQVICGHRAEVIQMRRNGITKRVKDKLVKSALRKIPPSGTSLFNAEAFTAAIEKIWRCTKMFLAIT